MTRRGAGAALRFTSAVAAVVATLVSGCGSMNSKGNSVQNPLTPEQSKAQVVDSARDIVGTLRLQPVAVTFYRSSCNDQHEAPFRGVVSIDFPKAATFEQSDAEVAAMTQQLQAGGWTGDADFKSHGTALKKNNIVAVFAPQNASTPNRSITLYGECRDMTSTKDDTQTEYITLG
jgi:hypothetical protein